MTQHSDHIALITNHLFRHESGKMVSVLTKIFGTENLEMVEDVVQDSFVSAINAWKLKGIPDNPSSWLYRVAKNKAIDIVRKNKHAESFDFIAPENELLTSEYTINPAMDQLWKEDIIQDDLLKMMFACCNDDIPPENQMTLILKTLCGFSTNEIAKAFLTSEDTISKRLYRTKEFFRRKKIRPEFPTPDQLKNKTSAVLKTIYLIFNEGYNSTHSEELIRKDLLEQAIYLATQLSENENTALPETFAALALMYFHAARIDSRISNAGEIILLADQDRSKWKQDWIMRGNEYLNKAAFGDSISTYHIEAAIAFEHCTASSFDETNWTQILRYYDMIAQIQPDPVVMLNRLMVVNKVYGADHIFKEIADSPYLREWDRHYLFHSLLGEIYSGVDVEKAKSEFEKAIMLTKSEVERKLLMRKICQLDVI